jgi:hypothetical protein
MLCLIFVAAAPAFAAEPPAEDGYTMQQTSDCLGEAQITVTKHALKEVTKRDGLVVVAKAPDWDVIFYNPKTKLVWKATLTNWHGRNPVGDIMDREPNLIASHAPDKMFNGIKMSHIVANEKVPRHKQRGADYWYTKEFGLPQQLCTIVQRDYAMPPADGFPIEYDHIGGGVKITPLLTTNLQHKKIPASAFAVPDKMTRVNGTQMVMYSNNKERSGFVQELLDGMSSK